MFILLMALVVLDLLVDKILRWCKVQFYAHLQWRPGVALWFIFGGWPWYSLRYHRQANERLVSMLVQGHAEQATELKQLKTYTGNLDSIIHAYTKALYGPKFEVYSLRDRESMLAALKQHKAQSEPLEVQQLRSRLVNLEQKVGNHIANRNMTADELVKHMGGTVKIEKTKKGKRITTTAILP